MEVHLRNKNHLIEAKKYSEDPDVPGTAVLQLEADYRYDVLGNRIEKAVDIDGVGAGSATATRFAHDGWNPAKPSPIGTENFDIWGDFTSGGSLTTRYFRGDKVDELLARVGSSTAYWYLHDHLQSIRKVIDSSADVKDSIVYDAFGNILSESASAFRGRYAWTGREIDTETLSASAQMQPLRSD